MRILSVSAGRLHALAVDDSGGLWGWGSNEFGQIGDGTTADRFRPVHLATLLAVGRVVASFISLTRVACTDVGRLPDAFVLLMLERALISCTQHIA